ncbi:Si-specific NAD(P)(+) transhydrogenase [bacterium]|nr:Si-specific NAD(P)(+) transhydrogenase [bacterium]
MPDYEVTVIGCGPAGQKAAIKCAKAGKKTAIIDARQVVGGHCLHIATIPSKTLREAIIFVSGYHEQKLYAGDQPAKKTITAKDLLSRVNVLIQMETEVIHDQLTRNGVHVISGDARFTGPHELEVTEQVGCLRLTSDSFVIASGSVSHIFDELPFDGLHVLNTDDILKLSFLPKKMMIVGAGVTGVEYACMFSLLDIEVLLISRHPSLLHFVDRQLVDALVQHMQRHDVKVYYEEEISDVHVNGERHVVGKFKSGEEFDVELLLYAATRFGNTAGLNLEAVGLQVDERSLIKVNEHYQTQVPYIYAAGDVIGFPSLASTSIDQGRKAANALLGLKDVPYDEVFPFGIYSYPEISMVGASEEQLKKQGSAYAVGIGHYKDTARGQIIGDVDGLLKLLFDRHTHKLLGAHIIGEEATELIHLAQAVIINDGKIDYFVDTVLNYPTLTEVYKVAALNGLNKLPETMMPAHRVGEHGTTR